MEKIKRIVQPFRIINFILIIFCIFGFVYQVYLIFTQYMLGKTVVNLHVEVKRLKAQTLPAITVCIYESIFSISKLSKINENNRRIYQDYMKTINESISNKTLKNSRIKLRSKYYQISLNNRVKIKNLSQVFELSLTNESIEVLINVETKSLINQSFIKHRGQDFYQVLSSSVESFLAIPNHDGMKCLTYFSALQEHWNSFEFDLKEIQFSIRNNFKEYAPVKKYLIAIHSPNILQKYSELDYFEVKPNEDYSVKYSQLNTELLAEGFESNCAEYDTRNEHAKIRMESDCRVHCLMSTDIMKNEFYSKLPITDYFIRRGLWSSSFLFDPYLDLKRLSDMCSESCKPECNTKQYFKEVTRNFYISASNIERTNVNFQHNSIPDVIVRHSLEMTLMSFVCNFGGLLGIWLGFSTFSISKTYHVFLSLFQYLTRL